MWAGPGLCRPPSGTLSSVAHTLMLSQGLCSTGQLNPGAQRYSDWPSCHLWVFSTVISIISMFSFKFSEKKIYCFPGGANISFLRTLEGRDQPRSAVGAGMRCIWWWAQIVRLSGDGKALKPLCSLAHLLSSGKLKF